ncbi:MAG: leucine-rich repeat protein [Clostridia bacterium]|nr:leucine-rich repeat protein [Clostridia bacterium]
MKKCISYLMIILILTINCLIAAYPTSATDINYDDFDIIDGVIVEYIGAGGDVVVPSKDSNGNPVTYIDSRAFRNNELIESVVISEGIEYIGSQAFELCKNLTDVYLPYSLKETGHSVFSETGIKTLVVPGRLKTIPLAFLVSPCTDIIISPGVENISTAAFGCSFSEVILPSSVKNVGALAFAECKYNLSIYVCNPNCNLGVAGAATLAMIWAPVSISPIIKICSAAGSAVETFVKTYQKGTTVADGVEYSYQAEFVALSSEKLAEYEAKSNRLGITAAGQKPVLTPTKPTAPKKPNANTSSNSGTGNQSKPTQSTSSGNTSSSNTSSNSSSATSSSTMVEIVGSIVPSDSTASTESTPNTEQKETNKTDVKEPPKENNATKIIIIVAAVVLVGAGATVAFVLINKKKRAQDIEK